MSILLIMAFSTEAKAEAVRRTLLDMHEDYLIEPRDAVIATSPGGDVVQLNQLFRPVKAGEAPRMYWAQLIELLLMPPRGDNLSEYGMDDVFVKGAAMMLRSANAVLLLLVRETTTDKVAAALRRAGGRFLFSSFDESRKGTCSTTPSR